MSEKGKVTHTSYIREREREREREEEENKDMRNKC